MNTLGSILLRFAQALRRQPIPRLAPRPIERLTAAAVAFSSDTSGIILPYVTLMLIAIVGLAVLALDGARYMSLQTQLQNGADALALAGAAELDRLPDSEDRAIRAVRNLITESHSDRRGCGQERQGRGRSILQPEFLEPTINLESRGIVAPALPMHASSQLQSSPFRFRRYFPPPCSAGLAR